LGIIIKKLTHREVPLTTIAYSPLSNGSTHLHRSRHRRRWPCAPGSCGGSARSPARAASRPPSSRRSPRSAAAAGRCPRPRCPRPPTPPRPPPRPPPVRLRAFTPVDVLVVTVKWYVFPRRCLCLPCGRSVQVAWRPRGRNGRRSVQNGSGSSRP
jgi:hypothetical protein